MVTIRSVKATCLLDNMFYASTSVADMHYTGVRLCSDGSSTCICGRAEAVRYRSSSRVASAAGGEDAAVAPICESNRWVGMLQYVSVLKPRALGDDERRPVAAPSGA